MNERIRLQSYLEDQVVVNKRFSSKRSSTLSSNSTFRSYRKSDVSRDDVDDDVYTFHDNDEHSAVISFLFFILNY